MGREARHEAGAHASTSRPRSPRAGRVRRGTRCVMAAIIVVLGVGFTGSLKADAVRAKLNPPLTAAEAKVAAEAKEFTEAVKVGELELSFALPSAQCG